MTVHRKTFHFSILPTANAWLWRTLNDRGDECEAGLAPSRKLAAACVIRALARQCADPSILPRPPIPIRQVDAAA